MHRLKYAVLALAALAVALPVERPDASTRAAPDGSFGAPDWSHVTKRTDDAFYIAFAGHGGSGASDGLEAGRRSLRARQLPPAEETPPKANGGQTRLRFHQVHQLLLPVY